MEYHELWVREITKKASAITDTFRKKKNELSNVEINWITPDKDIRVDRVAAVDGGMGIYEAYGTAIYLVRATAVILDKKVNFIRKLEMGVVEPYNYVNERVRWARDALEFKCAIDAMKKSNIILLDGSISGYLNVPKMESFCSELEEYFKWLIKMLELAKKRKIFLIGVSKDTKTDFLLKNSDRYIEGMTDATAIDILIGDSIGMTPSMKVESVQAKKVLKEDYLKEFSLVYSSYMRLSKGARIIRVDMPEWIHDKDEDLFAILREISSNGYPAPLHIAHNDATIPKELMDKTFRLLRNLCITNDPEIMKMMKEKRRRFF